MDMAKTMYMHLRSNITVYIRSIKDTISDEDSLVANKRMKKVGEKVGFKIEGTLRNYIFDQGESINYYIAGITREDWKNECYVTEI